MKLQAGQPARDFQVMDIRSYPVGLKDYAGKKVLLSFYRYASCPLCNLRVHDLIVHFPEFRARGLHMLAVFQSPAESIRRYVGKQLVPFPVIADPARTLYRLYGVEPSWAGLGKAMVLRLPMVFEAMFGKGFVPGRMEGDKAMIPADFLIGPDLVVYDAFYGKDIGDHMPIRNVENFLKS